MLKQTILLTILALCVLSNSVGGYTQVDSTNLSLEDNAQIEKVEGFARQQYSEKNPGQLLIRLVKIYTQVVSGVNYKLQFTTSNGDTVEVTVYYQSWTDTIALKDIQPVTP